MNFLDICLLIIFLTLIHKSYRKRFSQMIFSIMAILIALYLSYVLSPFLNDYLEKNKWINSIILIKIVSFASIFIIINFLIRFLGKNSKKVIEKLYLGWLDSLLGGIVGLIKAILVSGILLFGLNKIKTIFINHDSFQVINNQIKKSLLSPYINNYMNNYMNKLFPLIFKTIPENIKNKGKMFLDKNKLKQ